MPENPAVKKMENDMGTSTIEGFADTISGVVVLDVIWLC